MCTRGFLIYGLLLITSVLSANNQLQEECQSSSFVCWKYQKSVYQVNPFNFRLNHWDSNGVHLKWNLYRPTEAGILSGGGNSEDNGILLSELAQNRLYLYDSLYQFKSRVLLPDLLINPDQKRHLIYYSHKFGLIVYLADAGKLLILREKDHKMQIAQSISVALHGTRLEVIKDKVRLYMDDDCISQARLSQNVFSIVFTDCSDI